jgi:ankyrin repeat protein
MPAACMNSDIDTVTATLYLSNVDLQVSGGYTALHYACARGNVEIVRMLLSAFADTHITDDDRRTPAMLAEIHGHTELLPYLRCTLSDPPVIPVQAFNTNNSVSISVLSIEHVTQHNTPHIIISRPGTIRNSTKRSNRRIV